MEEGEPLEYTPEHEAALWGKYSFRGGMLHGQVSLGLHAQKLLDEKYVATAFDSSGTYGTRREVTGSVTYRF